MTHGLCQECSEAGYGARVYRWRGKLTLKEAAFCPACGSVLQRTALRLLKLALVYTAEVYKTPTGRALCLRAGGAIEKYRFGSRVDVF